MAYDLETMLVVGVASSALYDLADADTVFRQHREAKYREYQEEHIANPLEPGVAYPFIKRLLSLNNLSQDGTPLVEVIILSRNDPETGLRVMRSVDHYKLPISRAIFTQGRSPFQYMGALNMPLFLSQNEQDVRTAIEMGFAPGQVIGSPAADPQGTDLRIAFDFDGILADDSSERVMQTGAYARSMHTKKNTLENPYPKENCQNFSAALIKFRTSKRREFRNTPTTSAGCTLPS